MVGAFEAGCAQWKRIVACPRLRVDPRGLTRWRPRKTPHRSGFKSRPFTKPLGLRGGTGARLGSEVELVGTDYVCYLALG